MVDLITIITGIAIALIATFLANLGVAFQKKGLKDGLPEFTLDDGISGLGSTFSTYFKNKYWMVGFILGIVGWIPYIIAQGMVGIIIVQPIQSVGLILLVIISNKMLNENISTLEVVAICMLIIAPVLIAFSGISNVKINLTTFVLPLLIFLFIVFLIIFICILIGRKQKDDAWAGLSKIIIAGLIFSIMGMFSNILIQACFDASINIISPLGWVELLFGILWFEYFHLWVFLGLYGTLMCGFIGIIFQNNGMQKGKAVVLWPIQSSINLLIPIIGGFIVFNQSVNFLLLFILAIVLILIATIVLSKFQAELQEKN